MRDATVYKRGEVSVGPWGMFLLPSQRTHIKFDDCGLNADQTAFVSRFVIEGHKYISVAPLPMTAVERLKVDSGLLDRLGFDPNTVDFL